MNTTLFTGPGFSSLKKGEYLLTYQTELPQVRRATAGDARFRINRFEMRPPFVNPGGEEDKDDYQGIYEQFIDGAETTELTQVDSYESGNELTSLKENIDRTKEDQNDIHLFHHWRPNITMWLNFIKGIADPEDLCLNNSRVALQQKKVPARVQEEPCDEVFRNVRRDC